MGRGLGLVAAAGDLPAVAVALAALLTQLGDTWFLFVVLATLYWFGDAAPYGLTRRRLATVVALAILASGLITGLKALFALPRPPGAGTADLAGLPRVLVPVVEAGATADGYSFPSGHALGTTVVYGALALAATAGRRTHRLALAGAVAAVVGLTRVVLGVHYLVDVLAGAALGVAVLAGAVRSGLLERPGVALWLAVAGALFAVLTGGYAPDPMAILGVALAARLAWSAAGDALLAGVGRRRHGALAATVGLPTMGSVFIAVQVIHVEPWVSFLVNGLVIGAVVALPLAVEDRPGAAGPQ